MSTASALFIILLATLAVAAAGAIVSVLLGHAVITVGRAIVED